MSFILDHLPWWLIPALGGIGLLAAYVFMVALGIPRRMAWTAIATLGVSILAATIYQKGRTAGVQSQRERQDRADDKAVRTRREIEDALAGRTEEESRKRMWVRAVWPALVLIVLLPTLAACTSPGGSFCKVATPIYAIPLDQERASRVLIEQINIHNETGAKLCGWTP